MLSFREKKVKVFIHQCLTCDVMLWYKMCSLKLCHAWIHTYRLGELQMGPSKYIQSHFDYYPGLPPPLREANQHIFTLHFCLCFERSGKLWPRKRPWRAPPGPKVHLSLQHTGQTASLKYTHLPMFIHCRPLESKYNVECKGLKPPIFHQLTKSPTVGSFFSLWYFQSSTHKKELVLDAFP